MQEESSSTVKFNVRLFLEVVLGFKPVENITAQFSEKDETEYSPDQLKKITHVQQVFKTRNLLMDFDYTVNYNRFNFKVYFLKIKNLLLFQIFLYGEPIHKIEGEANFPLKDGRIRRLSKIVNFNNMNDQTVMDSLFGNFES